MSDDKIVDISDVVFYFQFVFDVLVKFIEVDVCEELACPVAKWHSFMECFCFVIVQNELNEPYCVFVVYMAFYDAKKNVVIDCFKVVVNVCFENIPLYG